MKKIMIITLLLLGSIGAQAQVFGKVYNHPQQNQILSGVETFAIMPFDFEVTLKGKHVTEEDAVSKERAGRVALQQSFYTYCLKRSTKFPLRAKMQPIAVTNATLESNGVTPENMSGYTPSQLCMILGVDAIVTGQVLYQENMGQGAAIVSTLLLGGARKSTGQCTIQVYSKEDDMIFNYGKSLAGGLGSDTNDFVVTFMRKTARKFPLFAK